MKIKGKINLKLPSDYISEIYSKAIILLILRNDNLSDGFPPFGWRLKYIVPIKEYISS